MFYRVMLTNLNSLAKNVVVICGYNVIKAEKKRTIRVDLSCHALEKSIEQIIIIQFVIILQHFALNL